MPETKTQRSRAPKKAAPRSGATKKAAPKATAARKRSASAPAKRGPVKRGSATGRKAALDRTTELSEDVLQYVEQGQRAAIDAVKKFVDTVDRTLPHGESASRRQEVVDSAMEMADRLVHTQYDFIRKVVDSAGNALGRSNGKSSNGRK